MLLFFDMEFGIFVIMILIGILLMKYMGNSFSVMVMNDF